VVLGRADFDRILVFDVSRWGRFQDADEAGHYEFICRQAGVGVEYCSEEFKNDGSDMSAVMKYLTRIAAGKFSRDLSKRVLAGQCRLAGLGYWYGGPEPYGLRRELLDERGLSRGLLAPGERKFLQTDRVILRLGPEHELQIIRRIFHDFAFERKSTVDIARALNREGRTNQHGRPWTTRVVRHILENENYIGTIVYNRTSTRLGQKKRANPSTAWVRGSFTAFEPVVEPTLFQQANDGLIRGHQVRISDEKMLAGLRSLLAQKGRLSANLINEANELPCACTYTARFGSLPLAYQAIKHNPEDNLKHLHGRRAVDVTLAALAAEVSKQLAYRGRKVTRDDEPNRLNLDGYFVRIYIARHHFVNDRWPRWTVGRQIDKDAHLTVVARMNETNDAILDYYLLCHAEIQLWSGQPWFIRGHNSKLIERFRVGSVEQLVRAICVAGVGGLAKQP
jgi:DNA invertase Pin-like site-specific DNA recombinase